MSNHIFFFFEKSNTTSMNHLSNELHTENDGLAWKHLHCAERTARQRCEQTTVDNTNSNIHIVSICIAMINWFFFWIAMPNISSSSMSMYISYLCVRVFCYLSQYVYCSGVRLKQFVSVSESNVSLWFYKES